MRHRFHNGQDWVLVETYTGFRGMVNHWFGHDGQHWYEDWIPLYDGHGHIIGKRDKQNENETPTDGLCGVGSDAIRLRASVPLR